jgi:hypothetical protein
MKRKFDLLYEEIQAELISEGLLNHIIHKNSKWTFEEECKAIIPTVVDKIKLAFNKFGLGELKLEKPQMIIIDEGTQKPGFRFNGKIEKDYALKLIKYLSTLSDDTNIKELNDRYGFLTTANADKLDLVLKLYAEKSSNDVNLAKIKTEKIEKFKITDWKGKLYLNFFDNDDKKNIRISEDNRVNVQVSYERKNNIIDKTTDFLNKLGNGRFI